MAYATVNAVKNILSSEGVDLRVDDQPEDELADVLDEADAEVEFYLFQHYAETQLATSRLVNRWASVVAAVYLCQRRGNPVPVGVAKLYDEAVAKLEAVRQGRAKIPRLRQRLVHAPRVDKHTVTQRPFNRPVTETSRSAQPGHGLPVERDPYDALGGNRGMDWVI